MAQISIFSEEYPKVQLTDREVNALLGQSMKPGDVVRRPDGTIDTKATLANSPLTRALEIKEAQALETKGNSLYDNTKRDLDAFERRLYAAGIKPEMTLDVAMTEFYRPDNRGLFPELIERAVLISENTLVNDQVSEADLVGQTINIPSKSTVATKLSLEGTSGTGDRKPKRVAEGAGSKTYTINETDETVRLKEYGFKLKISDAAKKLSTVDELSLIAQELAAAEVNIAAVSAALDVLIASGYTEVTLASASTLAWKDILTFFYSNEMRFSPDFLVTSAYASGAVIDIINVLNLANLTDPIGVAGNATQDTIPMLRGRNLKAHEGTKLKDKLVGIRKNLALKKYECRDLIQSEWQRIADGGGFDVYHWRVNRGYHRFVDEAVRILVPTGS